MTDPSSYFDKTWMRPSNMLTFFSDECKDNLNCGCGNKAQNSNNSNDEINNEDINNEIRGRAHTATEEDASLFTDNSLLSRRMSRSLSPSFFSHQSDQYDGCGAAAAAYVAFPRFACHEDELLENNDNQEDVTLENVENGRVNYQPYYSPQDFTSQTWLTAISETISIQALAGGATFVLGAVVIVHPLVLVGAATAAATAAVGASVMYAVGLLCDIDKGYAIWLAEDFGSLFWKDAPDSIGRQLLDIGTTAAGTTNTGVGGDDVTPMVAVATVGSREIIEKDEEHLRRVFLSEQKSREQMQQLTVGNVRDMQQGTQINASPNEQEQQVNAVEKKKRDKWNKRPDFMKRKSRKSTASASLQVPPPPPHTVEPPPSTELRRTHSAPATPSPVKVSLDQLLDKSSQGKTYTETVPREQPSTVQPPTTQQLLSRHFPPLEHLIVQDVSFPNLHTAEFFRVFFADDAPYGMKDFQLKRGDVDVVYGKWMQPEERGEMGASFKDGCDLASVASGSVRERTMTFNTLTKSYFGPAYAKATKIQRAVQLSDNLLVIENQTQLADIPFADRFRVVERWIVDAVKHDKSTHGNTNEASIEDMALSSKLTVYAEVIMLKSCSWEAQIQKKASETFNDLVTDWVITATKALKATEEQKRMRLGLSRSGCKSSKSTKAPLNDAHVPSSSTNKGSELIAQHRRNFQELDKRIKNGDLEWCSIEVMHSSKAGKHSAFVLESHSLELGTRLNKSSTEETDITDSTDDGIPIMAKRRSRNFLRLLSSRKVGSRSSAKTR